VHSKRDIVDAILYVTKTGAQWRLLLATNTQLPNAPPRPTRDCMRTSSRDRLRALHPCDGWCRGVWDPYPKPA
jgi:transposase